MAQVGAQMIRDPANTQKLEMRIVYTSTPVHTPQKELVSRTPFFFLFITVFRELFKSSFASQERCPFRLCNENPGPMLCSTLDTGEYVKDKHADDQGTSRAAILDLERTFACTNLGA
jgi:hypothetical protein